MFRGKISSLTVDFWVAVDNGRADASQGCTIAKRIQIRLAMERVVTPSDLRKLREGPPDYALIDVREKGEYSLCHLEFASPVPRGDLEWRIREIVPNPAAAIVLYCSDGRRSRMACETLNELGYGNVSYLSGGLEAWQSAGYPTLYGWGVPGKDYGEKIAAFEEIPSITPADLTARQRKGEEFIVLDVRTAGEYENGHLPGAHFIPIGQLPLEAIDLIGEEDKTVIVNCAGRTRSILGAHILRLMGLRKVLALIGGTTVWNMVHGYPLERGREMRADRTPSPRASEAAEAVAGRLSAEEGIPPISLQQLQSLRQSGALHYLIDVRLPREYAAGHIPGAISCQVGLLPLFFEEIIGVRNAPVIMTCDARVRATLAASLCRGMGLPNVSFLEGGVIAWTEAGLPLETGKPSRHVGTPERHVAGFTAARARVKTVAPFALRHRLNRCEGPVILDVRGGGDYAVGHLQGARWLSRSYLELRIGDLVPDKSMPVATVCDDGIRSVLAAATLLDLGYRQVEVLEGGCSAWQAAGYPVEEGLGDAPMSLEEAKGDPFDPFYERRGRLVASREEWEKLLAWIEQLGHKFEREKREGSTSGATTNRR